MNKKSVVNALLAACILPMSAMAANPICVYQEQGIEPDDFAYLGQVMAFDRNAESAATVYDYGGAVASSYSGVTPPAVADTSQLFFVETSEGLSLFNVHDAPGGNGGSASAVFMLAGATAGVLVNDDPAEATLDVGGAMFTSTHNWLDCCTDGTVIGGWDADEDWSMTVDVTAIVGITTWQATSDGSDPVMLDLTVNRRVQFANCPDTLTKTIVAGNVDGAYSDDPTANFDALVLKKPDATYAYSWTINHFNPDMMDVLIKDTAPAEWIVLDEEGEQWLECGEMDEVDGLKVWRGGKPGKKCHAATHLEWMPDADAFSMLQVDVETRRSPGKGHGKKGENVFAPTSCGALYINDGAMGYELDEEGMPVSDEPSFMSNQLCLAVVDDISNGYGMDADNDQDGIADHAEACTNEVRTDPCMADTDGDNILDGDDNCPLMSNEDQLDTDSDGMGDVCDDDADGDSVLNDLDNCPLIANEDQLDFDLDGIGDACDNDLDGDTVLNDVDNCPLISNLDQLDTDLDNIGDVCDDNIDGDSFLNDVDNCPLIVNEDQLDTDFDNVGDVCDDDIDGDSVLNGDDNCPLVSNPLQTDVDLDGFGAACDPDDTDPSVPAPF